MKPTFHELREHFPPMVYYLCLAKWIEGAICGVAFVVAVIVITHYFPA